jgi:penicillin-binding protein 1C
MFKIIKQLESIPFSKIPESETKPFTICSNSGQKSSLYCKETYEAFWPQTVENSTACTYHQLVHLDKEFKYQVNSSCYNVDEINHLSWFILPPVQAWYYRQYNLDYKSLPSFKIDCQEIGDNPTMQMIYPSHSSKIFIPRELNGKMGETIFEAAHSNIQQIIYWHLDGEYLGSTTRNHQMGIIADRGNHQLTLLDGQGLELKINFEVLNEE